VGAGACHTYAAKRGRAGPSQSATTVMLQTSRDQAVKRVPDTKAPTVASTHRRASFLRREPPTDTFLPVVGPRQRPERLSRGNHSPYTTCDTFVPWRSAWHTLPDLSPPTHPCVLAGGVGRVGAAPSTHQDQGLMTSRS
jgi:hypothetical protein